MDSSTPRASTPAATARPRHVAIIMDGNGRWATGRGMPRVAGHNRGVEAVRATLAACGERGIEYLTLFAFSSENWRRPADEVSTLMRLFMAALQREVGKLDELGVRMRVVGDIQAFSPELRRLIAESERRTERNGRLHLTICANYGSAPTMEAAGTLPRRRLAQRGSNWQPASPIPASTSRRSNGGLPCRSPPIPTC